MHNFSYDNFSVNHIVTKAKKFLQENNVKNYNISAVRLAEYCLEKPIYLALEFSQEQLEKYILLLNKRINKVPLQHLLKKVHFRYLELESSSDAFIARPETELIVDEVIKYVDSLVETDEIRMVDLCTGSGNIAISLGTEVKNSKVYAVELSEKAFELACRNNIKYGSKVEIFCDDATKLDWVENIFSVNVLEEKFDCVVSNPPYVPNGRVFYDEVSFDPSMALYGGGNKGLDIPEKIVDIASLILKKGGLFVIEHDDTHQKELLDYVLGKGFSDVQCLTDLNGLPRFIKAIY